MEMGRLTPDQWNTIYSEVTENNVKVSVLAQQFGVSPQAINQFLRKKGIRQRNERIDKGKRKLSKEIYNHLGVLCTTKKQTAEQALKNLVLEKPELGKLINGQLIESVIHPATLNRYLREDDLNKRSKLKRGSSRMVAERVNQVWQWDSTRATQWYVDQERDGDIVIDFANELSENKNRSNNKSKLTFMVFQDMCSRKVWFKVVAHENTFTWLEFFYEVASEVGLPENIYSDNARMFSKSGKIRGVLEALGVTFFSHLPGNSQAKGMVEKTIQKLEVEARVTLIEKAKTLKQYNKILAMLAKEYNYRVHSTTKQAPEMLFHSHYPLITKREAPDKDTYKRLCPNWDGRKLNNNLSIKWMGKEFQAVEHRDILVNYIGKTVRVEEHHQRQDLVYIILEGREIEAKDIRIHGEKTTVFGQFKDLPESNRERRLKEFDEYKENVELRANYEKRMRQTYTEKKRLQPKEVIPFDNSVLKRKGRKLDISAAKSYIAFKGINVRPMLPALSNLFDGGLDVYESDVDSLIREFMAKEA